MPSRLDEMAFPDSGNADFAAEAKESSNVNGCLVFSVWFPPRAIEEPKLPWTTFLLSSKAPFGERRVGLSSPCANSIVEDLIFKAKQLGAHHFVSELSSRVVKLLFATSVLLVLKILCQLSVSLRSGAMERSSSSYTFEARSRVFCLCNIEAPLVTSWTEENPGRRFYGCGLYKDIGTKGCNFFQWHDPVGNNRQKKIIVGLMKEVDELKLREKDLQTMISEMKMKEKCLWIVLVLKNLMNHFSHAFTCGMAQFGSLCRAEKILSYISNNVYKELRRGCYGYQGSRFTKH
ncbi:hypothetical protein HKD37_10G028407 [Glycine soja]